MPTGTACRGSNLEWKMRKDQRVMENGSDWEGAERWIRAEELIFPSWQSFLTRRALPVSGHVQQGLKKMKHFHSAAKLHLKGKNIKPLWQYSWGCEVARVKKARSWGFHLVPSTLAVFPTQPARRDAAEAPRSKLIRPTQRSLHLESLVFNHCHYFLLF